MNQAIIAWSLTCSLCPRRPQNLLRESESLLLFQLSQNIGQQSTATDNRLWPTIDSKFLWQILYIHFYRLRKERRGEWWCLASWTSEIIQTFRIISVVLCSGFCTWMLVWRTIHCSTLSNCENRCDKMFTSYCLMKSGFYQWIWSLLLAHLLLNTFPAYLWEIS